MARLTAKVGSSAAKGTLVTQAMKNAADADEAGNLIIYEDNAEQIANAINSAVAAALEEIGLAAEANAKKLCPVDTGRLRNSITHSIQMDEESVYIGTNVEYAPYVENGIHGGGSKPKREGAHFLLNAATQNGEQYRAILKKHLQK